MLLLGRAQVLEACSHSLRYRATTLAKMYFSGTSPQPRESEELSRLSPITK
jgi:hypothetical protein